MRYRILGGVIEAFDEQGRSVPLSPRLRGLLTALLGRAPRPVGVEALIDAVWDGDELPHDAVAALQALVARLRRTLGRDAVRSEPGGAGYRLAVGPDDIDAHRFERLVHEGTAAHDAATAARTLRAALDLWPEPAPHDPAYAAALRQCLAADLRLGRADSVIPELRALTEAHPYDETLYGMLLRALRDAGRPAEALAAYARVRDTLADGLGTDPGRELQELYRTLLAQEDEPGGRVAGPGVGAGARVPLAPAPPGNLRPRLTSFVGREADIEAVRSDLSAARLVTLTGPGGSGKTRLAQEAATGAPYPDGVWIAELAPVDDPEYVPAAVVSALGVRETVLYGAEERATGPLSSVDRLAEHCRPLRMLLILDNCEHVVDAAARLTEDLLTRCPGLTVLATSREPLGVPGEFTRPVEPLPDAPARRLFEERARAVRPGFDLTGPPGATGPADSTAPPGVTGPADSTASPGSAGPAEASAPVRSPDDARAVAEICRRLDGLPLAIELAAARLRALTPRQIAARLDDRFRLLTTGARTHLPRQQTLRAVVDWSWDLLAADEREALRRLSVFSGGWDLAAAEAVCGPEAADLLAALVDKSLVTAAPTADGMRFRLLETIHEYADERAAEAPAVRADAEARHTAYHLALAEEADPLLRGPRQLPWIHRLETELDNIRAALHRTVVLRDEATALRFVLALSWFWWLRDYRREGKDWLVRVIPLGEDPGPDEEDDPRYWPRMRMRMLQLFLVEENISYEEMRTPEVKELATRLHAVFSRPVPEAATYPGLMWPFTVFVTGGFSDLQDSLDAHLANTREHGGEWELGLALMLRTHLLVDARGGIGEADAHLEEFRVLSERVGDRWMHAQVTGASAEVALLRGRYGQARADFTEALRLAREVGAHAETPFFVARLAEVAFYDGDRDLAEKILDEASVEADRYAVQDTRAYVRFLRALLALDRGDRTAARAHLDEARETGARGTPPPQFHAAVDGIDALMAADDGPGGPGRALGLVRDALAGAVEARCAESVLAMLADIAAVALGRAGGHAHALRMLTAADAWRAGNPRPEPVLRAVAPVLEEVRRVLTAEEYEAVRANGATLTPEKVIEVLERSTRPATAPPA